MTDHDNELSGPAKAKTIEYISRNTAYRELSIVPTHLESGMIFGTHPFSLSYYCVEA